MRFVSLVWRAKGDGLVAGEDSPIVPTDLTGVLTAPPHPHHFITPTKPGQEGKAAQQKRDRSRQVVEDPAHAPHPQLVPPNPS